MSTPPPSDQPSFTVGEQTEEQRQLARQARDYGKVMQAMVGEGEGDDTEKAEGGTTVEVRAWHHRIMLFVCWYVH